MMAEARDWEDRFPVPRESFLRWGVQPPELFRNRDVERFVEPLGEHQHFFLNG